MKRPIQINIKTILLHMVLWIGVWFFYYYFFNYNSSNKAYVIWFSSLLVPLTMAATYFSIYFIIPKYLLQEKYGRFFLFIFYMLVASSYFIVLLIYGCMIFLKSQIATLPPMIKNFFFILILVYLVVVLVSFTTVLNHNIKTEKKNKVLQHKILSTQLQIKEQELQYLKMQIHPHFLFNTLNTIYGFAIKQSKQTPQVILMLSNLLDYILYQVNKPLVGLKQEVEHIEEYIELEKIRFQETLRVTFNAAGINEETQIAPMLLIPFVENAFKHGNIVEEFLTIKIDVKLNDDKLDFYISNTIIKEANHKKEAGIGLENIRKRLDLNYENNYSLENEITDHRYTVNLSIFQLNKIENG